MLIFKRISKIEFPSLPDNELIDSSKNPLISYIFKAAALINNARVQSTAQVKVLGHDVSGNKRIVTR